MQGQLSLSGEGLRGQGVEQFSRSEALVSGLHPQPVLHERDIRASVQEMHRIA